MADMACDDNTENQQLTTLVISKNTETAIILTVTAQRSDTETSSTDLLLVDVEEQADPVRHYSGPNRLKKHVCCIFTVLRSLSCPYRCRFRKHFERMIGTSNPTSASMACRSPCVDTRPVVAGKPLLFFRFSLLATFLAFPLATAAVAGAYWASWTAGDQTYVMTLSVVRHCDAFAGTTFCDSFFAGDTEEPISSLANGAVVASATSMPRIAYAILAGVSACFVFLQLVVPPCRGGSCASFLPIGRDTDGTRTAHFFTSIPMAIAVVGITGLTRFSQSAKSWAAVNLAQATPGGQGFGLASGFNCAAAASAFAILGTVLGMFAVHHANRQRLALVRGPYGRPGATASLGAVAAAAASNMKPVGMPVPVPMDGPAPSPYVNLPASGAPYQANPAFQNPQGVPYASAPPASAPPQPALAYLQPQPQMPPPGYGYASGYSVGYGNYSSGYSQPPVSQGMPMLVPLAAPYAAKGTHEEDPI